MRLLLAVAIFVTAPGPGCYLAAAASIERPGAPGGPTIVPKIESIPGRLELGAVIRPGTVLQAPGASAELPNLNGAAAPVLPVSAAVTPVVPAAAEAGKAVDPSAAPIETAAPALAPVVQGQAALEGALKPEDGDGPEAVQAAAGFFENAKLGAPSSGAASAPVSAKESPFKRLARAAFLAPLWHRAGKLSVDAHAGRLLDDTLSADARAEAARKLGRLQSRETIEVLGEIAAGDRDPQVRESARKALLELAPRWTPVLLKDAALHPLAGRRAAAARSLGWLARFSGDAETVDALALRAAVDINHDVRLTAIHALSTAKSVKALVALVNIRRMATKSDIISASEVAINEAIAVQQAAGVSVAPYHPAPGQFGSSKQPLYASALKKVIGVSAIFTAIEMIGGFMIGSLSLKADSMHLLADLGINAGALFALWMSRRPPNSHKTYGYLKMESLTGLLSAVAIAGMAVYTLMEAVPRLWTPVAVPGLATIALACSGLFSNALSTLLLYRYQDDNLSLKGAFLHAATDAIGSLGIIAAGAMIYFFHWFIADPIITFLIVGLIVHTTWGLAKRSWNVLIDAVPPDVKLEELEGDLLAIPGVASVYDLHVWSLSSSEKALTAVLYVKPNGDPEKALAAAKALVAEKHKIGHATLQVEFLKPAAR